MAPAWAQRWAARAIQRRFPRVRRPRLHRPRWACCPKPRETEAPDDVRSLAYPTLYKHDRLNRRSRGRSARLFRLDNLMDATERIGDGRQYEFVETSRAQRPVTRCAEPASDARAYGREGDHTKPSPTQARVTNRTDPDLRLATVDPRSNTDANNPIPRARHTHGRRNCHQISRRERWSTKSRSPSSHACQTEGSIRHVPRAEYEYRLTTTRLPAPPDGQRGRCHARWLRRR
jgi:hypothetical protein